MPRSGEPQGKIEISDFVEIADDSGINPPSIIEVGDPFKLWVEFSLLTPDLHLLEDFLSYEVRYWATAVDAPRPPYAIAPRKESTVFGTHVYSKAETEREVPAGSLLPGIYQVGAFVRFSLVSPAAAERRFPLTADTEPRYIHIYEP
ncbi:hypothetical protein [Parafrankia sp. EUN1f]|uniref:hypothetical protein n=1 Tax=Parafrankia sp. EUN1f TaxID=102897 RepID=UPI0001C46C1C|nr:hypothetical protein [Parafrankia sp. EUN1f]EFC80714.1 hypothetical protein FrEUN1fDRAFT_6168 [Parafrankia sp. EUN1f]